MLAADTTIYADYAPIYDAIGQGRLSARLAAWALDRLSSAVERPARVLDLACGSGEAALVFARAGCAVVGVDRSGEMLEIAQGKARDAGFDIMFLRGDIRELVVKDEPANSLRPSARLGLGAQFDLVTCFYDSLNYLTEDGDLDRVFAGAAAALRPGGQLIFDINTVAEYTTWDERDVVTYDGADCLVYNQLSYDPSTRLARGRIAWLVREIDRWWRGEETHTERAWGEDELRAALAGAGLQLLGRWDAQGQPAAAGAPRLVYVARRPHDPMLDA